jgi:antitoxin PrlF
MAEIGISSISEKGQVTIPKEIRDILALKAGDKVVFVMEEDNEIAIRKATGSTKKLSSILENQKTWKIGSIEFQRKARKEW